MMKKTGLVMAVLATLTASCGDNGQVSIDGNAPDVHVTSDAKDGDASPADVPRTDGQPDTSTDTPRDTSPTDTLSDQMPSDAPATAFRIGGTITGLTGSGLVLQNNGGDNLTLAANATGFTFAGRVAPGGAYAVTVLTQPSAPAQTCTVTDGSGQVGAADVTNVEITCTARPYTIGGTISGLTGGGLVLRNNGGDNLTVSASATTFTFATAVASGGAYAVTVLIQPSAPTQLCTVAGGTGNVGSANVTNVAITCVTKAFMVGGTISGLMGGGLTLRNNGGDNLILAPNATTFSFLTPVTSNAAFAVTVFAQPTAPTQTCTVSGGTGVIGTADVTSVVINCSAASFTVGGTVNGLRGTLVLHNGTENQTVTTNGGFAFPTPVATGGTYAVTVMTQPATPRQTCTVANGTGTIASANVTSVMVTCTVDTFGVRAAVTGLAGSGLSLRNGLDQVVVSTNGTVTFPTAVASGGSYSVSVLAQPTGPSQTCTVAADGSGVIAGSDVTATVTCVTNTYRVRTTVTGLTGTGLVLQNGADSVPVASDTTFNFPTRVASGSSYQVTVTTQPTGQTCTVSPGTAAQVGNADVSATVTCVASTFSVSGTISGLTGTGLVLRDTRNNGTENLTVAAGSTSFLFTARVPSGGSFTVSVATQPSAPPQICTVANGTGVNVTANVTNVAVTCVTQYSVSGTITGLTGGGLVLRDTRNNGTEDISPTAGATTFAFLGLVPSGGSYAVSVLTQPSGPPQICTVTANGSGVNVVANVTNVAVTCVTQYSVSGTISGLTGAGLVLRNTRNNGTEDISPAAGATALAFLALVPAGGSYAVSVVTQPSGPPQICTVANGTGVNIAANVTNVAVTCVTQYSVSGTIAGLTGTGLVLRDTRSNGTEDISPAAAATSFAFLGLVPAGGSYAVSVVTQPSGPPQICTIANGTGVNIAANVTNVAVTCVTQYSVSGTITGLTGSGLVLRDTRSNGTEDIAPASGATTFAFLGLVPAGGSYAVSVLTQPGTPAQTCTVTMNASGVGVVANVANVVVSCMNTTTSVCGDQPEGLVNLDLACPAGQIVSTVDFASFGTPIGACPGPLMVDPTCDSPTALALVQAACVGNASCSLDPRVLIFGDPCPGTTGKHLKVLLTCVVGP